MASVKLGSKSDSFRRQGQAWFCSTDLPSDVTVVVEYMAFHLHKFPLLSRCGLMEKLIKASSLSSKEEKEGCVIHLSDLPGGSKSFELIVKFCYGVKLELTASNVVHLRSASDRLQMTEEYGDGNLIAKTESFINNVVLRSWRDCLKALQACDDDDDGGGGGDHVDFVNKCVEVLAGKICGEENDPDLFVWSKTGYGHHHHQHRRRRPAMQSPRGSVLWNGISTGARSVVNNYEVSDWWYEDVSTLNLPIYKRLISAMDIRAVRPEFIAGSLEFYAKRYLPGLKRRHCITTDDHDPAGAPIPSPTPPPAPSEEEQMVLVEEIESMLPMSKGLLLVPTKFLAGMLRTAMILGANRRRQPSTSSSLPSSSCVSNLERRIGLQLDHAGLEDLLLPNLSYSMETLYNVDCVHRIVDHFLTSDSDNDQNNMMSSSSLTPITSVGKLIDGFLAEIASDVDLKAAKFQSLAAAIPEYARPLDDGLYRAIDIYLKAHPWLTEVDKEQLCRLLDCQKLSMEACTHAAQNERLPLRVVVQVLFFEQLQLRSSIAGCFLVSSDNLVQGGEGGGESRRSAMPTRPPRANPRCEHEGGWSETVKVDMDSMCMRVAELERECWSMKHEIEKMGKLKGRWRRMPKFGFKIKSQMCSAQDGSVSHRKTNISTVFGRNKTN